jgi:4-diphosphocytidyl-2-C-methyl-D-erythritol kinase
MEKRLAGICTIDAPCKINLHLGIGKKRPDGFHEISGIFASLALADTLRFECTGGEGESVLSVNCAPSIGVIKPENNLVLRALALFRERTGYKNALNIDLDKRIPVGAGLGGGSSDAASSLLALNLLAGEPLSGEELKSLAALLGSDVPFFLDNGGGAAFVSGRGELVEPVKAPAGLWVVLVKPPFSSDTASAYRLLDEARESAFLQNSSHKDTKALIRALEDDPGTWPFFNDFLPVFLDFAPSQNPQARANAGVYRSILDELRKAGASFAGLSGSGSCCFGVFSNEKMAEKTKKELSGAKNDVKLTFFLARNAKPVLKW